MSDKRLPPGVYRPTVLDKATGVRRTVSTYSIRYTVAGKQRFESTGSTKLADAVALLRRRTGSAALGKFIGPSIEKTRMSDLANFYIEHLHSEGKPLGASHKYHLPLHRIATYFGAVRVDDPKTGVVDHYEGGDLANTIDTIRITEFKASMLEDGYALSTINNALATLKACFTLAKRANRVGEPPFIKIVDPHNERENFLEQAQFLALRDELPDDLRDPITFLWWTGWRVGAMRGLRWRDVYSDAIRLERKNSKTKQAQELPLTGELEQVIARARGRAKDADDLVFRRADGQPLGDFHKAFYSAAERAGLGTDVHVHDLRRSAARNLTNAGVPQHVIMQITGHRTASMFRRYAITVPQDLANAQTALAEHLAQQPTKLSNVVPMRRKAS